MSYGKRASSVAAELVRSFVRTVWPEPCLACHAEIGRPRWPLEGSEEAESSAQRLRHVTELEPRETKLGFELGQIGLCRRCWRLLKEKGRVCTRCGIDLGGIDLESGGASGDGKNGALAGEKCRGCRHDPPPWRRLTWVWRYEPPLDSVILALKFGRLDYLGARLAVPLAAALRAYAEEIDIVVHVPLHWSRRLRRGYDQAELIARQLARQLERPMVKGLRRRRATKAQSHQDRGRRRVNLRSAFIARLNLDGLRVLLVDDVVTTGATLESATRALLEGGAEVVDVATVGRTPGPEESSFGMS